MPNAPEKKRSYKWFWIVLILFALYPLWKMIFVWLSYFVYGFVNNV